MSLGIKSSAFLRVEHPFAWKFDMSSTSGYIGEKLFQEFGPRSFDMSSASGYVGENMFRSLVSDLLTSPQLEFGPGLG